MEKRAKSSELIKSKINCFDLLHEFGIDATRCAGENSYRCKSFTHEGTNPTSCQVWQDSWYCHSSKKGGDVISMYAYLKYNGDNSKAFSDLLYRLNIGDDDYRKEEIDNYKTDMERLRLNVEQYHKNLKPEHRQYFYSRHIFDEFIDTYKCGYDPYSDRIIIPVWKDGQPIYWCARAFDSSKISKDYPKYKKPTIGFSSYRENELYGYDTLDRGNDDLWIAEGVFDFASLWEEGESVLCNATGMSNKHIQTVMQVAKDFKRLILCFDNDSSGTQFTRRMFKSCFEHNIQFTIVTIPTEYRKKSIKDISDAYCAGLKPNELLEKYSRDGMKEYLSQFDDYDSFYAYINPLAPYLNRKMKNHVINYINECISFNSRDRKDLIKMLDRSKTQNEIAADFIREYEYDLWHDVANGMYRFNGTHWQSVNEFIIRKAFERMYDVRNNEEKSIIDKVKVQTTDEDEPMPNQKECFNVANGTIYFDKNNPEEPYKFERNHNIKDYCDYCQPYDYNPKADDSKLKLFLHQIFANHPSGEENMINRFKEYLGSLFNPTNIEGKAIMWIGDGSNGKSKLNEIIEKMLGDSLCCAIPVEALSREFRLQSLIGKWVNFFHDPKPDTSENENIMKNLCTNDKITTNVKNKEPVSFHPRASIFIDANECFHPKDKTNGWQRRFTKTTHRLYNSFTSDEDKVDNITVFPADDQIIEHLCEGQGLSAILNYALEGYTRLVRNGNKYTPIPRDVNMDMELLGAGNHLFVFASQFEFDTRTELTAEELYMCYRDWYLNQGYLEKFILTKDKFSKRIEQEFIRADRAIEKVKKPYANVYVDLAYNKDE